MSIASIAAGSSHSGQQASQTSLSQLSEDYSRFMKLLVAQIQNQDPLNPVDNTEFISQVAQLTQVEQAVLTNQYIADLSGKLAISGALFTTALIGRKVTVPSEEFQLVDGRGTFSYELDASAASVTATITNATGQVVRRIDLGPAEGGVMKDFTWDGTDGDGMALPGGSYGVSLSASGSDGTTSTYQTFSPWTVLGVDYSGGETLLRLEGGASVAAGKVIRAS